MKIAIISDTHDNIPNIEKFLSWAKENKIETIIHCGDIATGETIQYLTKNFKGKIYLVYGNMDAPYRNEIYKKCNKLKNAKLYGDIGELKIPPSNSSPIKRGEKLRIAFCHLPNEAKALAQSGKYNLVFYGHTHKPWLETLPNNCQLVNPGTLGDVFQKATFAIFDTAAKNLELKILETL